MSACFSLILSHLQAKVTFMHFESLCAEYQGIPCGTIQFHEAVWKSVISFWISTLAYWLINTRMLFQRSPSRFFRKGQSITNMSVNLDVSIPDHFFRVFAFYIYIVHFFWGDVRRHYLNFVWKTQIICTVLKWIVSQKCWATVMYVLLQEASDSDTDGDNEDFDEAIPDRNAKILTVKINSLRTDLVVKAGLSVARK